VAGALAQPAEPSSPQDGQIWIDTDGTAPTTVVTRWTEQPAAGTTVLTGNDDYSIPLAYSPGYEQVFLNGVLLSRSGSEYTATNGTSITLAAATVAGDIVEVICPLQIATTDTYTQSAVNNAFVANTGYFAAGKNLIINGGMDVWQRGTSSTGVNGYFTADRWYNGGGGTVTISQSTDVPTGVNVQYSQRWLTGASSSFGQYYYALEQAIVKPLRGQSMVLSYYIKTAGSHGNSINTEITYSNSTDALVSQTTGVTETGDVTYSASSVTSWTRKFIYFTVPADAVGLRFSILPDTVQASGVSQFLTGVQLEIGSVATTFARAGGTLQGELAACQRYYIRFNASSVYTFFCNGNAYNTTVATCILPLPVTLRTAPSSIETTGTASNYRLLNGATATACSAVPTLDQAATQSLAINFTVASGLTAGQAINASANNTASAYIGVSAEL
jgi:hypothetical protein